LRSLFALAATLLLAGCAVDLPQSPPAQTSTVLPTKGVVYVYRLRPLGMDPLGTVTVDCGYPVTLSDDEYTEYFAAPGDFTCTMAREGFLKVLPLSGDAAKPVHLDVTPGKVYYVRVVMAGNLTAVTESFAPVDPAIAQGEIRHCNKK
jgi:hypothetical protein